MTTRYDNSASDSWALATRAIHVGQSPDEQTKSRNLPIYNTSSYVFDNAEHAAARFGLADPGPIYTRLTNPTVDAVEQRLANLECGVAAVLFASGQAAETAALLTLARAGDHIVASPRLYGGTETLLKVTLPRLGITTTFVENPDDPESWQAAVQDNTVGFYAETIANPQVDILDVPTIAEIAHNNQVPLIVDNTVATPVLIRPIELGADIVVSSATKYLTGNGSALGGILVDGGEFDWTAQRDGRDLFPNFTEPDEAYHGLKFADLGAPAFALRARAGILRDTGAAPAPFNAWGLAQGLDTLALRVERHNANAQKVAEYLESNDRVAKVNYAGLPSSPWYQAKQKLGLAGAGAVLSFDLKVADGADEESIRNQAWAFIDALKLHSNVANIGDVRSLVVHPATTTHSQSDAAGLKRAGINQSTVRLAVGIEAAEDIIADLEQAFAATA
ncbi:O-acetylhomoserine/O-acetylserine sulfhydrylase [Corynebacterium sp. TAE3-ERU12]|uniref:O-acetylhomoserine/O-acetylserine sulfhydrylase n=1 Tax=Corynebacterium sp. TAE3-ERU12 TaxID=2849491 RepID=UPI001C47C768|nr:O-acetylhomoserine/O-acetylserine sulfhydrylase [Corynebacterium sp. TAE3-ERU12]MBV7294750.1 O-acetylhomoserine/O-acetylserine sulfhydrylase [Corynebacterium sp. TAE3-ERU12]